MEAKLLDLDPSYQAHREQVDEVQKKYGVDRKTAIGIVNDLVKGPEQPDRPAIPGSTASGVTGKPMNAGLPAEQVEQINAMLASVGKPPLTPEEAKALAEKGR